MNTIVEHINSAGHIFVEFALPMLIQSSVLIVILLLADLLLRKKVKAVFRYWIWMLVLAKLVLPTSLSSPLSLGYWFGDKLMYVTESEMGVETEAEAVEPAPTDMLPIINIVPIEVSRHTPAVLPMIPGAEPVAAEPVSPPPASVTPLSWQGIVFLIWLAVVIVMGLLLLQRALFVRGLVAQAKEANRLMNDALVYCCERMGVKRKLGLKVSANATSPAVCGLIRPMILLPRNLLSSLGAGRLRAVLMHELAHIKRGDLWVNLVQTVLQIIYFYNPLLWLANCVIRRVREQAVDEAVLVAMGEKAKQYPQTLVSVAKLAFKQPALSLRLIGVVESKSALAGRIKHILGRPMPKSAKIGIVGVLAVIIAGAILLPMAKGEWEKDIRNPVSLDENGKPIVTHTLYMWGQKEEPIYQLEGKTYRNVGKVVARIGELMKQDPFPYIRVRTTKEFQRQQEPIENLSERCRSIGFINMEFKYDLLIPPGTYQATLPNGVTVELVGVCEHPSEGKQWWRPDGTDLEEQIHVKKSGTVAARGKAFAIAARVNGPEDMTFKWGEIDGSYGGASLEVVGSQGQAISNMRAQKVHVDENLTTTSMRLGAAAGNWETKATHDGSGMMSIGHGEWGITFSKAFQPGKETKLIISDDFLEYSHRIVAIDLDGNLHTPARRSWGSAGKMRQTTVDFNILLDNIKEFQFQTRPYQWVTFKNVSLRPGAKTDVQVEVGTGTKGTGENKWDVGGVVIKAVDNKATLPNGVTVELVGICEHPSEGKQWWRPDGSSIEADGFRDYDFDDAIVPEDNQFLRLLALRFDDDVLQNIRFSWVLKDARESRFEPDYTDKERKRLRPIQVIEAAFPKAVQSTNLQLGVATGPWKSVAAGAPATRGAHTLDSITQGDVIYHEAREDNGYIHISATHLLGGDYDCRIVAKGKDGKVYEPSKYSNPGREMRLCKSEFDIPLEQVKWFYLQARPFQWLTFKNVSLKPNFKTDVQVEGEKPEDIFVATLPMAKAERGSITEINTNPEADQQQRVRELVYVLRHMPTVFSGFDQWVAAIKELVEIGKPAVPELVAELDRTERDLTMRAIGYTLRAITDPRAVPVLIRTLPKAPVRTSDCALQIGDRELRKFMMEHHIDTTKPSKVVDYGRAVREITAALEKITGHSEGYEHYREPESEDLEDVGAVRNLREEVAKRWQIWWAKHWSEFVTGEQLGSVTITPRQGDPVDEAGRSNFGPNFLRVDGRTPLSEEDAIDSAENQAGKLFAVRLHSGITVELVGISYNPSWNQPWWKPDGSTLETAPYDRMNGKGKSDEEQQCYEFAIHLSDLPETRVDTKWKFIPSVSPFGGGYPWRGDKQRRSYRVRAVKLPRSQETTILRFGIASGKWNTFQVFKNMGSYGDGPNGIIVSRPVTASKDRVTIGVTHNMTDRATRVVAIDHTGNIRLSSGGFRHGPSGLQQIEARFSGLLQDEVKEFRFETRPYEWVTFKNVSLQPGIKPDVQVEGEYDNNLYQKQGSIRYALEFIGTPEELIDTTFVSKHGQLANPRQLEFANKLFRIRKSKDVDAFISLLSDGTKEQLNDGNNRRMLHNRIKKIKEGTFLRGQYDFKFFATFREFTDEDWDKLKEHVSFAEPPTHAIVYYHFHKGMSLGSTFYLIEDNGSYKFVAQTLLSDPIIPAKKEQPTGPKEYGIVAFKQTDNAYAQPAVWKYHWNIELSPEVSEKNTFQILKTTKVVSGQADLHPEIAAQKIIDESMIEKHKYDILKCRFYVDNSEPRYNYHQYGRKLSGWLCGLSIANTSKSTSMLFPGKDVTNVKPNKQGNFIGSDLELISFETSEENIRYEHKVILRKDDSPEAKSAALLRLEQMTRRRISNKKLQYLDRILTAYANDHNSEYPDRLDQIKSYDTDEWLDWLLENIEYLGKGKTLTETSKTVIAYDKTLLEKAGSTNVLFNEGPVQYCNPNWLKKIGITGVQKSDVQVERIEPRALDISKTVTGIATDKLGRLRGNVYIAPQSTSIWKGIRSDTQGRFTLEDVTPEQKKWVAYSQPSQAMGLFTIPENYTGQPIHVILNFREAEVEGRVVDPDGKGLADRKVELITNTKQGVSYYSECYRKTDKYGNYSSNIPCGSSLTVQAKLADANESEQKYVTKAIALSDNQIFVPMPRLVIGEGQPEQTDDGKVLYSGRVVNEQGDPIQGVEVQMMYKWQGSMGVWGKKVMTDEQGRWKRRLPKDLSNLRIGLLHPEYIEQSGYRASSAELLNGTNVMVMKQGLWLRGVVKNQQGEPIENALVDTGGGEGTTPYGEVIENCTTPRTLADGSFSIGGLAAGSKDIVVSAVGYAPRVVSVEVEDGMEPIEVSLKGGTAYVGQVVDVDGNPIEGVKIDVGDWRVGKRRSSITRMTETDSQGLFKIEDLPEEGKLRFDFGKRGSGFQGFSKEMPEDLSHRDKIVMYKTPVFVGKVIDAETEEPITSFEVVNGVKWKSVDESFHWSRHYKKQVNSEDGAFAETWSGYHITYPFDGASCLKIEAKGYLPEITPPIKLGGKYEPFVIRLTKAEPWEGIVVDREGRPAVKAEVGWVGPDKKAFIKNGRFDATGWVAQAEVIVETNENGQFELNPTREEGLMVVVHSDGYAHVKSNDFKSGSRIQLIPWAKIEGTIASADTKSREFVVAVNPIISSEDYESQPIRWLFDRTSFSDKHFIIDYVPSIPLQVGQIVRWEQSNPVYIKPQPGEAYKVQIGGRGRTVTGKIIHPIPERARETGEAGMSNPRRLHAAAYCIEPESKLPDEIRDMSERSFLWLWRDATNVYERSKTFDRRFIANIEDNGTFRFDNMPPGEYEFVVNYHAPLGESVSCGRGVLEAVAITGFKVDTDDTRPIHLPDIRMSLLTYPEVGDPASLFEARSLDGKVIRLEDFRGKVVLLDFWATWCRPCLDQMPKLKKIYEAFAANPRFAMIGMSVDWDLDKAKRFVADNGLKWPHACLGDMSESLIVKQYGVGAIPTAILIGGDGKIIAGDLRAEEIKSAVAKALGTASASNKRPDVQVEVADNWRKVTEQTSYARLVFDDEDKITFQGQYLDDINDLSAMLANLPEPQNTVLEWAFAPGTMPEPKSMAWLGIAYGLSDIEKLVDKYGLKSLVCAGEQPLGSRGGAFKGLFRGTFSLDKEIPVDLQSSDGFVKCQSIKFEKTKNELKASLQIALTSYPKTKWESRLELRDADAEETLPLYQTFENSGIIEGFPLVSDETIQFSQGKFADFSDIDSFELRVRQVQDKKTDVQIKTENNIQAPPLKDFERKLIEQLLDLVKQVEKQYPEQATHWPAGAGLYHIDAQGEVTVWHYRALWRRSTDCAPDEVGWGSSQLVNATGMYYLPDGTPLQSRWRERGGGMKDIRVKVGRTIDENERVAVIHRHSLPSNHDLLSRDRRKRKIEFTSWKKLPVAIIVRIDKPVRLDSWWLGGNARIDHYENYEQLIVIGPPGDYQPMYVYFLCPEVLDDTAKTSLKPGFETNVQVEGEAVKLRGAKLMEDSNIVTGLMPVIKLAVEGTLGEQRPRIPRLHSEPGPGILKGIVRDTADTSYHLAYLFFVPVESWPGKPVFYYLTTVNESFEITGIPPGTYYLFATEAKNPRSIDAVGLSVDWPKPVTIRADGKPAHVEIEMATFLSKKARFWNVQSFLRGVGHLNAKNVVTEELGPYGKVSDAKGRPVPYATVQVREFKPNRGIGESIAAPDARTNEKGYYGMRPLDYPYFIGSMIYAPLKDVVGYRWQYLRRNKVFEGKKEVNFEFGPWPAEEAAGGTIAGTVVDGDNNPIPSFIIDVRPAGPFVRVNETSESWYKRWGFRAAFAEGKFTLRNVPVGNCNVRIMGHESSSAGSGRLGEREITVAAGQTIHLEFQIEDWEEKRKQRTVIYLGRPPVGKQEPPEPLPELKVGDKAPLFEVETLGGKSWTLADHQGKVVLLNFWVAGSNPSENQLTYLKAVYEAFRADKRFVMLGLVRQKRKVADLQKYLAMFNARWDQTTLDGEDKTELASKYGVRSWPAAILIGPDGKVIARNLKGNAIKWAVEKALMQAQDEVGRSVSGKLIKALKDSDQWVGSTAAIHKTDVQVEVEQSSSESGGGRIVVVSAGKSTMYSSIKEAVDAAPAGSVIRIGPGVKTDVQVGV